MTKHVLLGVSSGIAAYKSLELIQLLKKKGVEVRVIMTERAQKMISPVEFEKASGHKIYSQLFEKDFDYSRILKERTVEHIELADNSDVMVIAPATANTIAKLAHGIADDFLTTTALAITAPIIVCPSMNVNMWNNPVVQENIEKLKKLGFQIIEPDTGMLACGYEGKGRLADVQVIADKVLSLLHRTESLKGKKIIITAGGTIEKIDEVRSITNRSSGKMGIALAEECYLRGADVMLLRAKHSVTPRYLIPEKMFSSSQDLFELVKKCVLTSDVFFHTSAVSDFQVEQAQGKISSKKQVTLSLKPQLKILDQIKKINPKIFLIGFKAEYDLTEKELTEVALKKLESTNADVIIANDISRADSGFEADYNEVHIVLKDRSVKKIPRALKRDIAKKILDFLTLRFMKNLS